LFARNTLAMDTKDTQNEINRIFKKNFGYTPLNERLKDIQREFFELMKWSDVKNLKEEAGDLLCSLIQLHTENDWSVDENVENTLQKIESRYLQYKSLGRKTRVAIYGGAFDPITIGHIQVAQFILNTSGEFDEVWLMPAYKHMYGKEMASPEHRLNMCSIAAKIDKRINVFNYEIKNELAGETYYFVKKLKEEEELNKHYHFSLVIGLDNAVDFDKWVNYEMLERLIRFVVIPRKGYGLNETNAWFLKEPHIYLSSGENNIKEVSSTGVRKICASEHDERKLKERVSELVPEGIYDYILNNKLYNI
jgi:nicotinate-nucleotide adenylyltransferase